MVRVDLLVEVVIVDLVATQCSGAAKRPRGQPWSGLVAVFAELLAKGLDRFRDGSGHRIGKVMNVDRVHKSFNTLQASTANSSTSTRSGSTAVSKDSRKHYRVYPPRIVIAFAGQGVARLYSTSMRFTRFPPSMR